MEEPEIALPPHSQRRLTRYLLKKMGQAIVTSHSPHVINEFEVTQILAIDRDEKHHLSSTAIPTEGIKFKAVRQRKLQLAEAILARGIIVAEGATEVATLIATSRALEAHWTCPCLVESHCLLVSFVFEIYWAFVTKSRMPAHGIIEPVDISGDGIFGLKA